MSAPSQRLSSSSSDLTLVVESKSGTAQEFFAQVGLSIGRAKSNTIHIDHPHVDRIHAKVVKCGEAFWMRAEPPAKLPLLDPEPGEVEETELFPGLSMVLGGMTIRCRRRVTGMGSLSDDYWADAAGGERFKVEHESFNGDLPKKIGPYEIRKFVARGGMGIVLQGIHESTAQPAAVKLPTPDLNRDEQWLRRFEQEVRTLKSVTHPNLVRLQDAGTEGELHWMAMDWVEGETIAARISNAKASGVDLYDVQQILLQVVAGLNFLHGRGMVHRDLKPGNLLVGQDSGVKVADFGLAKQVGGEQSTVLTRTGTFAGTLHYMAPEQAEGQAITAATDVYALGVIWYELLTGRRPASGRLKLEKFRADCPDSWRSLLEDCLDVEAEDRPSLNEIKRTLEAEEFAVPSAVGVSPTEEVAPESAGKMPAAQGQATREPIEHLPQAEGAGPFVNWLGMQFVPVTGTKVQFCIWPTRVRDYSAYAFAQLNHNKSILRWVGSFFENSWESTGFLQENEHPVVNVSWNDACAFCAWLTIADQSAGKLKANQRYRLPTDAEWSKAVGLGKEHGTSPQEKDLSIMDDYPWGKKWPPPMGAGNYSEKLEVDSYKYTSPVGSFAANAHGIHDLGGNVWEWCVDKYTPNRSGRVLRGASWRDDLRDVLFSSSRNFHEPGGRLNVIGFRCVLANDRGVI